MLYTYNLLHLWCRVVVRCLSSVCAVHASDPFHLIARLVCVCYNVPLLHECRRYVLCMCMLGKRVECELGPYTILHTIYYIRNTIYYILYAIYYILCYVMRSLSSALPPKGAVLLGRLALRQGREAHAVLGKGQMGSALMGSLQILCFLTEGLFGCSRQPTFIFPKVPGRTFFHNLSKFITAKTVAAAALVLTPFVRNQGAAHLQKARPQPRTRRRCGGWSSAAGVSSLCWTPSSASTST